MNELEILEKLLALLTGPDHHKHRCPKCYVIWEHDRPPPTASDEDYARAHLCPRGCGIDVRDKYHEEEVSQ